MGAVLSVFGIFNVCTDGGCTDTIRETALEDDSGEPVWPSGKALG